MRNAELTVLIQKDKESGWYVGQIEEFPSAISQGQTIDELKDNLIDALKLLLDTNKRELDKDDGSVRNQDLSFLRMQESIECSVNTHYRFLHSQE